MASRALPECWGHRGASVAYPENTLASFEKALRDGAEGVESDIHVSLDDVVLMFHDPFLNRTTNGKGFIKGQRWYGPDGMQHLRTLKEPKQPIPTFAETIALFMQPENRHAKLHVDIKASNDPERLFELMHKTISSIPDWETALAPRLWLGVWHPKFIPHATRLLPYCTLVHIGFNLHVSRTCFWESCDVFSVYFGMLASRDGLRFRDECKRAGKKLIVWTLNRPEEMIEAVRWDVDVLLTDVPHLWHELHTSLDADFNKTVSRYNRTFLWTTWRYYAPIVYFWAALAYLYLQYVVGPLQGAPRGIAAKTS